MRLATTCTKVIEGCGGLGSKLEAPTQLHTLATARIPDPPGANSGTALRHTRGRNCADEIDERRVRRSCEVIFAEIIHHSNLASLLLS
jgi:hypothetical protein